MADSSAKKSIDDCCKTTKLCQLSMVLLPRSTVTLVLSNSEIVFRDSSASQLNLKREEAVIKYFEGRCTHYARYSFVSLLRLANEIEEHLKKTTTPVIVKQ